MYENKFSYKIIHGKIYIAFCITSRRGFSPKGLKDNADTACNMYCTVCPIFRLETFLEGYNTGLVIQYR